MRVRDVEIALVLAREMKEAAARDVDASLRLEQLKEVFGAEELDAGERARIQTALQMAGLEPQPSLLEADPAAPIRFSVEADEAAPAPAPEAPVEERQEFPTVGEFFGRFRRKRRGEVLTEAEPEVPEAEVEQPEAELPLEPAEPEELYEPEPEPEPEVATNGHVEVETNGHAHLDLDDVAFPPHDTATPADFGASAETIDFDDPRVEEELLYEAEAEAADEPEEEYEEEEVEWALEPEPEPIAVEPEPEPIAVEPAPAQGARVEEIAALLLPLMAIPVLISSFAGWTFGLPFVALSLIAMGILAGRRAGFFSTLRASPAARTILKATVLVTAASIAIGIVLANVDTNGGGTKKPAAKPKPKAKENPPAATHKTTPQPAKPKAQHKPRQHKPKTATTPSSPAPDDSTKGLIRVPPPSSGQTQTQTQTTPTAPQQPTP